MGAQVKEISKLISALLALQLVGLSLNADVLNENSVSKRKFTNEWQEIGEGKFIVPSN